MSRRGATLAVSVSLAVALGLGGSQVTVPYVGLGPGPLYNTLGSSGDSQLIVVPADRDHPAGGELDLTTVNVYDDLTLVDAVWKWFDRDFAVVPRDLVFPKGQSPDEAAREAGKDMEESQNHAITSSLCALGTPVTSRVVIEGLLDGGPAAKAGILKGDVLTGIDRKPVDSVCTLRRLTRLRKPGDVVAITVRRAGAERTFDVHTNTTDVAADGRPLFGVELVERDQKQPFPVTIAVKDVGGPSAGLMFALGLYDRLTPGDLTGGKIVAGTGTIDDEGVVGAIGGIQQKLAAAADHKAEWFLTPAGNYEEALAAKPGGLKLVRVATLDEALAALREIAAGRNP